MIKSLITKITGPPSSVFGHRLLRPGQTTTHHKNPNTMAEMMGRWSNNPSLRPKLNNVPGKNTGRFTPWKVQRCHQRRPTGRSTIEPFIPVRGAGNKGSTTWPTKATAHRRKNDNTVAAGDRRQPGTSVRKIRPAVVSRSLVQRNHVKNPAIPMTVEESGKSAAVRQEEFCRTRKQVSLVQSKILTKIIRLHTMIHSFHKISEIQTALVPLGTVHFRASTARGWHIKPGGSSLHQAVS